jgi:hypothetical protein
MRIRPLDFDLEWRRAHPFPWGRAGAVNPFVCHFGTSEHTTTETQNKDPWGPQQPYLTQGFQMAGNLANQPPPQQQNPVAPFNDAQIGALTGIANTAGNGTPIPGAATNFGTSLLNGGYLNSNPSNGYFSSLANTNLGTNGPGADVLKYLVGTNPGTNNAGTAALAKFANGGYFSNGYSDDTAQSIMANVVPQIAAQFNRGGAINNPLAARSAAEGATAALAPLEYQNQQVQEQLAQGAASTLGSQAISGAQTQGTFAQLLQQLGIQGGGLQATGASGLANNYQDTLAKMVQGQALAPQTQALSYADLNQLFGAGSAAQSQQQNEQSGQAATYNFSQMSPYQQLAAYMQAVTGNYGGTSTDTKPYFTNDTANTMGTVSGIGSLAATIIPFL